jgi:RNA polymerase II subunit A small phosphatase-like protein
VPKNNEHGYYTIDEARSYDAKRLDKVTKLGFSLDKMLIIDDTPAKVAENYGNAIYPKPFMGDKNDTELMQLLPYLLSLKESENVRKIEKRFWRKT